MKSEVEILPGVRERTVRIASCGVDLAGILTTSDRSTGNGLGAVLLHGWGTYRTGPHDMLVKLARRLAGEGISTLRFDLRGRGESPGDFMETDLDGMIDDAAAAAGFLRSEVGAKDVAAVGLCSGANVALASAAFGRAYQCVASISVLPFQSHKSSTQDLTRTRTMLRRVAAKAFWPSTWWRLLTGRVRIFRVFKTIFGGEGGKVRTADGEVKNLKDSAHDLMGSLARYRGRLLFVWGGADPEGVSAKSHFEEFCSGHHLDAQFRLVDGANHNFYSLSWEQEVFDNVTSFLSGS